MTVMRYREGEAKVFASPEDVPAGWNETPVSPVAKMTQRVPGALPHYREPGLATKKAEAPAPVVQEPASDLLTEQPAPKRRGRKPKVQTDG